MAIQSAGRIELDLADRSWETHGHSTNAAFDNAVLHVFVQQSERLFFTRTKSNRNVPQVRVDPAALPDKFSANVPLARPGRCQAPLKDLPQERLEAILNAASQFRLQRKAARLKNIVDTHGRDAALFQEIAAALGYKQNKLAFTLLAQRLPLSSLRKESDDIEAMLFGVAGFLQSPDLGLYPPQTRAYVRKLWDRWWPRRDEMQRLVLPAKIWRLGGGRPLNHPQRRLGALAILANEWPGLIKSIARKSAKGAHDFFLELRHPFWNFHYTLTSDQATGEMAIVGASRIADILANVLLPYLRRGRLGHLARLREIPGAPDESTARDRRDPPFRRRPAPSALHQNNRPAAGIASDLRGFLFAGQFRLRAMPVPGADAEMEMKLSGPFGRARLCRATTIQTKTARQSLALPAHAFTLIELLVVIVIIAVLMGLAFPVFQGVQNQAKKAQAKNDLIQIVTAVNAFYTEYGKYPSAKTADSKLPGDEAQEDLMDALPGQRRNSQIHAGLSFFHRLTQRTVPIRGLVFAPHRRSIFRSVGDAVFCLHRCRL